MATLHLKHNNTWKQPRAVYAKVNGGWAPVHAVWEKNNGTWIKHWPNPGSAGWATGGMYYFTVPNGIFSLSVQLYGGGGGSGATNSDGNAYVGGGGGAGGVLSTNIAVNPTEVLGIRVGQKGYGASARLGTIVRYNTDNNGNHLGFGEGSPGGDTIIYRGSTPILIAYGGRAGKGLNNGWAGGPGGAPVAPGAANNGAGYDGANLGQPNINLPAYGGTNNSGTTPPPLGTGNNWNAGTGNTGWGKGGGQPGIDLGCNGQDGAVFISWS